MVHFVGAGSGAADLITMRGYKLLQAADIVIYAGSLVNEELLEYTSDKCEIHNSAKMDLDQVMEVITNNRDKNIVRLHTGDPSIFGAIREQLASHQATMVIFLSTGLLAGLVTELLKGGYKENTPCAIVYKATWKDEKVIRGIVKNLPSMAKDNGITKTALIVVGDFLGSDYELSKLYDPTFTTEFREGQVLK